MVEFGIDAGLVHQIKVITGRCQGWKGCVEYHVRIVFSYILILDMLKGRPEIFGFAVSSYMWNPWGEHVGALSMCTLDSGFPE